MLDAGPESTYGENESTPLGLNLGDGVFVDS